METPGERIKKLRKAEGLSNPKLAKLLSVSTATITFWERDEFKPGGENLNKLCRLFKTTSDYILYGTGLVVNEQQSNYNSTINTESASNLSNRTIPIISWVQAGDYHSAEVETDVDEIEKVATYERVSPQTYALRVIGESMTTTSGPYSFPPGSIIIIDPEQSGDITDGVFVIAKENGADSVTFKQLKYDGTRPYLNPLNPDYPKYFGEFRIIGKVVDFRPVKLP
jgi:SOS-response transcriptional repressor LexA